MRIGVLTGGGDAPGLNAVIRGLTIRAVQLGHEVVGIRHGWQGILDQDVIPLGLKEVADIHRSGGTILFSSRTNPERDEETSARAVDGYKKLRLDALVGVGGDDTLGALSRIAAKGIRAVGVPKTIDNDIRGTDVTFGYDTAVNIAMEALDRLHTTAASHQRCLVVEIMGRHAGWIAWAAGIAGGAHTILLPEEPFNPEEVAALVQKRDTMGQHYTIVAVAEGARPQDGHEFVKGDQKDEYGNVALGGIAQQLASRLEALTGKETRHIVLGHLQRGGAPTAADRVLGTRLGVAAADLVEAGDFGKMLSVQGLSIRAVALDEAAKGYRVVPTDLQKVALVLRGE